MCISGIFSSFESFPLKINLKIALPVIFIFYLCIRKRTSPDGGIGRRAGFRDQWPQGRAGSIPVLGTRSLNKKYLAHQPRWRNW